MDFFNVGEIVTLKSHPLFSLNNKKKSDLTPKKISEFPAHVPPLMLIKEVLFEREDKKVQYSDVIKDAKIADIIKYVCVFFNANKSEFEEKIIYHSLINIYTNLLYFREFKKDEETIIKLDKQLIPEVSKYKNVSTYEYGKRVQFKTKKLEHRKSYFNSFERNHTVSFQTPDFVLSGIRKEEQKDLFYLDGKPKRIITEQLYKVMWFNHFQQKFSEHYLPKEFFVEGLEI